MQGHLWLVEDVTGNVRNVFTYTHSIQKAEDVFHATFGEHVLVESIIYRCYVNAVEVRE